VAKSSTATSQPAYFNKTWEEKITADLKYLNVPQEIILHVRSFRAICFIYLVMTVTSEAPSGSRWDPWYRAFWLDTPARWWVLACILVGQ
jgi:hypothetical protein